MNRSSPKLAASALSVFLCMTLASPGRAQEPPKPDSDAGESAVLKERRRLLTLFIPRTVSDQTYDNVSGAVFGGGSVLMGVGGVLLLDEDPALAVAWIAGAGVTTAVGATSLLLGEDGRDFGLPLLTGLSLGSLALGLALSERSPREQFMPKMTAAGIAVVGFSGVLLEGINLGARYGSIRPLRAHRERLKRPDPPSDAELEGMERDFLATDVPIAPWVNALPGIVGSAIALPPAFDSAYDSWQRGTSGLVGGLGLVLSVRSFFSVTRVDYYRARMQRVRVEVGMSPSGPFVAGIF